ncbi:MAG: hypothetical protein ACRDHY_17290 [Anaerolineales bacterium]
MARRPVRKAPRRPTPHRPGPRPPAPEPTAPSPTFDRIYVAISLYFTAGLFLDGYAHNHLLASIESFFTPWHAVFYSGFFATVLLLGIVFLRGRRQGLPWREAVPPGYDLALIGAAVFFAGGVGDMIWHTFFGIEAGVEALLSPTHLTLALGGTLIGAAPLRAAWRRREASSPWTAVLAAAVVISSFTFMTQFAQPTYDPWATSSVALRHEGNSAFIMEAAGISGLLIQAALFSALALYLLRRWPWQGRAGGLPFGAFTLILGLNSLGMAFMHFEFRQIPAFLVAGLFADVLYRQWKPGPERRGAVQAFAFTLPALVAAAQYAVFFLTDQVWWSVHLWAGSIVLSGFVGWLLSLLAFPATGARVEESMSRGVEGAG